jgi:hypothetical protein
MPTPLGSINRRQHLGIISEKQHLMMLTMAIEADFSCPSGVTPDQRYAILGGTASLAYQALVTYKTYKTFQ